MCGARGCEPSLPRRLVNLLCERRGRAGAELKRATYAPGVRSNAQERLSEVVGGSYVVLLGSAGSNTDRTVLFDTVKHPTAAVLAHESSNTCQLLDFSH
jgi:hypothetical protein